MGAKGVQVLKGLRSGVEMRVDRRSEFEEFEIGS